MALEVTRTAQEVHVRVVGTFDAAAARRLGALLESALDNGTARVTLDFSRAAEVTDVALAAVAGYRPRPPVALRITGLSSRHSRMLDYLAGGPAD